MRHRHRAIPLHPGAHAARSRAGFVEIRGTDGPHGEQARAAEIAALPTKDWRGQTLYQIRCHGGYGKGPHDYWVPEGLLWSLIDLQAFRCPFHT